MNRDFPLSRFEPPTDIYLRVIGTIDREGELPECLFARIRREREGAEIYRRRARLNTGSKRRNELPTNRLPATPFFTLPAGPRQEERPLSSSSSSPRLGKRPRVLSPKAIGPPYSPFSSFLRPLFFLFSTSPLKAVAPSGASRFAYRSASPRNDSRNDSISKLNFHCCARSSKIIEGQQLLELAVKFLRSCNV